MAPPQHFNFAQDVIDGMAGDPRAGLLFIDSVGHRRDYTFAEIAAQSQRYAAVLRALGVTRGERVLLCMSASAKALFTLLAITRLGAVAVPRSDGGGASGSAPGTVIAERAKRADAEALRAGLPAATRYMLIGETREGWSRLDTLTPSAKPFAGVETLWDEPAYAFDSATWQYGAFAAMREAAEGALQSVSTDRVWIALPPWNEAWTALVQAPWWSGAATVVHEAPHDLRERLDLIRELDVTILSQTPEAYAAQLDLPDVDRFRLPRLRRCLSLDAVPTDVQRRWSERFGLPIVQTAARAAAPF